MKQWWGIFDKRPLTDSSLVAIVDALGRIGSEESIKILKKLRKTREGDWLPKVNAALKKIEDRTGLAEV
jgi:hypothetical protein